LGIKISFLENNFLYIFGLYKRGYTVRKDKARERERGMEREEETHIHTADIFEINCLVDQRLSC